MPNNRQREVSLNRRAFAEAEFEQEVGPLRDFAIYAGGCPACGHIGRDLEHCSGKKKLAANDDDTPNCAFYGEHLHARCQGCHKLWMERTKNDPENALNPEIPRLAATHAVVCALIASLDGTLLIPEAEVRPFLESYRPILLEHEGDILKLSLGAEGPRLTPA